MFYVCSICKNLIKEEAIRIKYNGCWNFYFHEECLKNFEASKNFEAYKY